MARFDRAAILEATDLGALADELLGPRRGTQRSATWPCPSPGHAQTGRTPPVGIFRTRSGEEAWHCHGCGIGGSAVDLVMVARGVTVRDALEELARRVGRIIGPGDGPAVASTRAERARSTPPVQGVADPEGLAAFVDECAERLWRPEGYPVLRWLTRTRGLPEEVLGRNRIGADPGRGSQARPEGMPGAGWAAVLPVHQEGRAVFAQLRAISALPGRPRYLNAAGHLAANPRVANYDPPEAIGRCVIVTEGVLDALSANAAGFPAAAVLGAAMAGPGRNDAGPNPVATRLAPVGSTLVVAFDADGPGQVAGAHLAGLLRDLGARVGRLHPPAEANDLNGWLRQSRDWPNTMRMAVRAAISAGRETRRLVAR